LAYVLEADGEVIGIAHHDHVASRVASAPRLIPFSN
jgi:hypothetical protein